MNRRATYEPLSRKDFYEILEKSEARIATDRKEAAARLEAERKESERRLRSHTRWLVATFI